MISRRDTRTRWNPASRRRRRAAAGALLAAAAVALAGCGTEPGPGPSSPGATTAAGPSPAASAPGPPQPCSPVAALTGWSDVLDKAQAAGAPVEGLSALAVDRDGRLLALSDRSVLFTLDPASRRPVAATPLADEAGKALDSEAVVVEPDGTRLVTSETEPSVRAYDPAGHLIDRLPVPDAVRVAPAGRAQTNKTFEGLALSPDGRTLVASMEGPLAGDDPHVRRLVTWARDGATGPGRGFRLGPSYGLRVDDGLDVSDVTATGDGRLLVLERAYTPGVGNTVHLVLADPRGADDVTAVATLPATGGPKLAATSPVADLGACPADGATARQAQRNPLLDNVEGVTVTGRAPDGRLALLLVSDDNERASQITRLYDLSVAPG